MLAARGMDPATHHLHLEPHDYHAPPISRTIQYKKVRDRCSIGDQEVPCLIGTRKWHYGVQKIVHETRPHYRTKLLVSVRWNVITHVWDFSVSYVLNFHIFAMRTTGLANLILVLVYQNCVTSFLTFLRVYFFLFTVLPRTSANGFLWTRLWTSRFIDDADSSCVTWLS